MTVSPINGVQLPQVVYQAAGTSVGKREAVTLSLSSPFKNPLKTVHKKCHVTTLDPPVDDEAIKYDWPSLFSLVRSILDAIAVFSKSKSISLLIKRRWIGNSLQQCCRHGICVPHSTSAGGSTRTQSIQPNSNPSPTPLVHLPMPTLPIIFLLSLRILVIR